jgi:hypothetical protein
VEAVVEMLLKSSAQYGAGYLIAALSLTLYLLERKAHLKEREAHMKSLDRLLELSAASIRADRDNTASLETLTRVLDSVDRRLNTPLIVPVERRLG